VRTGKPRAPFGRACSAGRDGIEKKKPPTGGPQVYFKGGRKPGKGRSLPAPG